MQRQEDSTTARSPVTIDSELSAIAAATWRGAHVLSVAVTGLWYLYAGPRPEGKLEGFLELGSSKEEAAAKLQELVASHAGERRVSVQELRSHLPGER